MVTPHPILRMMFQPTSHIYARPLRSVTLPYSCPLMSLTTLDTHGYPYYPRLTQSSSGGDIRTCRTSDSLVIDSVHIQCSFHALRLRLICPACCTEPLSLSVFQGGLVCSCRLRPYTLMWIIFRINSPSSTPVFVTGPLTSHRVSSK